MFKDEVKRLHDLYQLKQPKDINELDEMTKEFLDELFPTEPDTNNIKQLDETREQTGRCRIGKC